MALFRHLLDDPYCIRPSRMFNHRFGDLLEDEDFVLPLLARKMRLQRPAKYIRHKTPLSLKKNSDSTLEYGKDRFNANIDVQHFHPEEITVKVTNDNVITIEGKHEEREDEHGEIYRHFVRTITVPKQYDMSKIESKLSTDGVLSVTAPRNGATQTYKNIPITQTGEPAKSVEKKEEGEDN
uniref:Heat shock protein 21 n=1 Tax=Agasicles hygrophila TaxID=715812 RepID=A0A023J8N9_9CUCU|nr:heat shock protein 21 [Agasicles hygrophila]